jgi:hypothetical protein
MRIFNTILLFIFVLTSCDDNRQDVTTQKESGKLVPEPDTAERIRYEALQRMRNTGCLFLDPDTSVLSLKIRDVKSGESFIKGYKLGSQDQYRYYSKNIRQVLSLTQHPGDGKYQISVFRVEYAKKEHYDYRRLDVDTIKSGRGIRLGMAKEEIINRLGHCYTALDSTQEYIELYYRIETPKDTRTNLLANHNLPVYYASYKIRNGGLEMFEFGFEYP